MVDENCNRRTSDLKDSNFGCMLQTTQQSEPGPGTVSRINFLFCFNHPSSGFFFRILLHSIGFNHYHETLKCSTTLAQNYIFCKLSRPRKRNLSPPPPPSFQTNRFSARAIQTETHRYTSFIFWQVKKKKNRMYAV